ncbi:efflux transporter outer membrane subunit [Flavobacterium sp. JP2137]|uniref:efflux transporter outer membrane subunit n=1 Tax=Flavobacterium sp. JP2137 TaxID=3414510 RepID=UPI003D2FF1F0
MKKSTYKWGLLLVMAVGTWSSCQITRPYQSPDSPLKERFRAPSTASDTANLAQLPWTEIFGDTLLQKLIHQGLSANLDLKIAVERLSESQAQLRWRKSALYPSLTTEIGVKESRIPQSQRLDNQRRQTQYDWGLNSSWELDIWGKLGSAKRAALAQLLSTDAAKRAVQTQLIADIATAYYELLALDQQLEITRKTAANRAEDAAAIALLFENALLNGVAVVQSQANYYEATLEMPDLEQRIKETEHQLCFLLARAPASIERSTLSQQKSTYDLRSGIPAQLLAHRPDVQAAELNFRTAFEETNVARASFYPALTLNASGGFSKLDWKHWLSSSSLLGSVAGGLTQPLFQNGANKARLSTNLSRQQQALFQFEKTLLLASQEVSNALLTTIRPGKRKIPAKSNWRRSARRSALTRSCF